MEIQCLSNVGIEQFDKFSERSKEGKGCQSETCVPRGRVGLRFRQDVLRLCAEKHDAWELGLHSYLTYMRDRLLLCRDLLAPTGSIFVQISDENVHHVRDALTSYGPIPRRQVTRYTQYRRTPKLSNAAC